MKTMRLAEIGEFGLIDRIAGILPAADEDVVIGIGDDTAALRVRGDRLLLVTCDIQLEGRHFLREKIAPRQLGRKALAINLSDIASMGGLPRYALVSLGLPKDLEVAWVDDLYEGLKEEGARFGTCIVGGNITSSSLILVDITLFGEVEEEFLLRRSGAQVGDRLLVTGTLGASATGLAWLLQGDKAAGTGDVRQEEVAQVVAAHLTPTPRVKEGRAIAAARLATAMIDLSDGLASDVAHICERSDVGVRVEAARLPISPATKVVAQALGRDPISFALFGGEDYELLLTAPPDRAERLASIVWQATGTPLTDIGEIIPAKEGRTLLLADGRRVPLEPGGWDHFRK